VLCQYVCNIVSMDGTMIDDCMILQNLRILIDL
jgi:hypothetical protein